METSPSGAESPVIPMNKAVTMDDDPKLLRLPKAENGTEFTDVVFFHAHCNDGMGAAVAHWAHVKSAEGVAVAYIAADYGQYPDLIEITGKTVHILDFSFPPTLTESIIKVANKVIWLDHHKSAIEAWEEAVASNPIAVDDWMHRGKLTVVLDKSRSGAGLAWDHYHPGTKRPRLIDHIEDRDLWRFALEYTREFHFALQAQPFEIAIWENIMIQLQIEETYKLFVLSGAQVKAYFESQVESVLENVMLRQLVILDEEDTTKAKKMLTYGFVNCNYVFASEVGNMIMEHWDVDFAVMWSQQGNGDVGISYRSKDSKTDVSVLAKALGGGGHRNAAGVKMPFEKFANIFYGLEKQVTVQTGNAVPSKQENPNAGS